MSVRYLYNTLPSSKRVCSYYLCRKPILRNNAKTGDGRLWHWGCLNDARDEHFKCTDCFARFDATEASFEECERGLGDEFRQGLSPVCPFCGAPILKRKPFSPEVFT